ncbi:TadE/TadG family type IV pilus assembly protein [Paratractidigestivibacter sp.]|uniref:TadE/TadG family type IV pilus assembly protein n=1 Tax=Paratractidigestivibacter sp. TaxID=2847316 RepID=UPI002ABDE978|nr:TadE/TadG family type IV pilus assembly protein [Paratractidigestivibacter sp.]
MSAQAENPHVKWLVSDIRGQASVEAALLIPSLLVVVALLVQPACLLYTRSVMSAAAAEAARLAATSSSSEDVTAFVKRRLKAVPEVNVFHSGGESDWSVSVSGAGTAKPKVEITGHAKPLPLMAAISGAIAGSDGSGVVLKVSKEVSARASWVSGKYSDWVGIWK